MSTILNPNIRYENERLATYFGRITGTQLWQKPLDKPFFRTLSDDLIGDPKRYDRRSQPLIKAMHLLAEKMPESGKNNPYHSPLHQAKVAAISSYFAKRSGIRGHDYLLTMISALGHDFGHNGKGNPKGDPAKNERQSTEKVAKIMQQAGCSKRDINIMKAMIVSTAPIGPNAALRDGLKGNLLQPEQEALRNKPDLIEATKIILDADLYESMGMGLRECSKNGALLDKEAEIAGSGVRVNNDGGRNFLLTTIADGGFCSRVGIEYAQKMAKDLIHDTKSRLGKSVP